MVQQMIFGTVLQFSIVFDFVPAGITSLAIYVGTLPLMYSIINTLYQIPDENRITVFIFTTGVLFLLIPVFQRFTTIISFSIFLLGRWIQGAITVYTLNKLIFKGRLAKSESKRRLRSSKKTAGSPSSVRKSLFRIVKRFYNKNKIAYLGTGYILMMISLWLAAVVIAQGGLIQSVEYDLRLIWTGFVLISSLVSLLYSFSKLDISDEILGPGVMTGLIVLISGTEIYNFPISLDILSLIIGGVVYFGAIVWGMFQSIIVSDFF